MMIVTIQDVRILTMHGVLMTFASTLWFHFWSLNLCTKIEKHETRSYKPIYQNYFVSIAFLLPTAYRLLKHYSYND